MANLLSSFDRSLETYSASAKSTRKLGAAKMIAFGAAAAGSLLACSQAEADIVYSGPINFAINPGAGVGVDIDGDAVLDIGLFNIGTGANGGFVANTQANGIGILLGGTTNSFNFPFQGFYSAGDIGGSLTNFVGGNMWMGYAFGGSTSTDPWGVFANAGNPVLGMLGVQFTGITAGNNMGVMYAWVQIQLQTAGVNGPRQFTLVDFAYENMGNPIHFGNIPEPGSAGIAAMAMLALGAIGVRRRRKSA